MCLACALVPDASPNLAIPGKAGRLVPRSLSGVGTKGELHRSILARIPGTIGIGLIKAYRYTLSPLIGGQCRYLPTCSAYAEEAIRKYGLWAGGWMFVARFQRCGPNGASGYDPVPETPRERARWYLPWRYGFWTGAHMDPATRLDLRD